MPAEQMTSQFRFRPFNPARDFPALVELINTIDAADHSGESTTEDQQREQLAWPGRELARDRWVVSDAENDGQLIGFGDSWKMPTTPKADIYVAVHPAWRRRGLGAELLQRTLARAAEQGAAHVAVYADANNPAPHSFLQHRGFERAGAYVELHAHMPGTLESPRWPVGYTLRRYSEVSDQPLLVDVLNGSYGDLFGHKLTDKTAILRWLNDETAGNTLLLFDDRNVPAGICRVRPAEKAQAAADQVTGFLDAPGLLPAYRQPKLYRSLVLVGMELLRQHRQTAIILESWGDDEETIVEYCSLGFTRQRHFVAYRRSLSK